MTLLASCRARGAPPFPHAACALHYASLGRQRECQPGSPLDVVDGLASVTRKAWFSSPGASDNDDNRAAQ
jgi:hypothetical protein